MLEDFDLIRLIEQVQIKIKFLLVSIIRNINRWLSLY